MRLPSCILVATLALVPGATRGADDVPDHYRQSYHHEAKAEYAEALAAIDGLPPTERASYTYLLRRGWLLYLLGRHWDSIEAYRAAVALAPKAVEPRLGLMLPKMALHLWLDVVDVGIGVVRLDPLNYTGNSRLAWALYLLGRYSEAEQIYRKLLLAYPSDVEMGAGLGWSLLKQQKLREARITFDAVLKVAPDHASALEGRASVK